jgi:peptidoglycan/xylan/chitin deacetylase (PgdA/CDA1 family)
MIRKSVFLFAVAALAFAGCDKIKLPGFKKKAEATPEPAPAMVAAATTPAPATPAPEPAATPKPKKKAPEPPPKPVIDPHAQVVVLCYHRLEGKAGGALSIEPALFEKHMQEIKDLGLAVISMQDFLAWRRGEKNIPPKSVLITIDDGYVSGYEVGWPILKKYGYPFTMFVYLKYINSGGKSVTWTQLEEMRDAGIEIGSHTVSHEDLKRKPSKAPGSYDDWLKNEIEHSKKVLEEKLGIRCATIAYPFGLHNAKVQEATRAAGYEAAFTTYGQRLGMTTDAMTLGRYDVTTKDVRGTDSFSVAVSFQGMAAPSGGPVMAQDAAVAMVTQPMNNEVISNPKPELKANLSSMGAFDAGTLEMRVSGLGLVSAKFDEESKNITYTPPAPLKPGGYTVIVSAKNGVQRLETRWTFTYAP